MSIQLIEGLHDILTGLRDRLEFLAEMRKQTINVLLGRCFGGSRRFPGGPRALIVGHDHAIESDLSRRPGGHFLALGASWRGIEVALECVNTADRMCTGS